MFGGWKVAFYQGYDYLNWIISGILSSFLFPFFKKLTETGEFYRMFLPQKV